MASSSMAASAEETSTKERTIMVKIQSGGETECWKFTSSKPWPIGGVGGIRHVIQLSRIMQDKPVEEDGVRLMESGERVADDAVLDEFISDEGVVNLDVLYSQTGGYKGNVAAAYKAKRYIEKCLDIGGVPIAHGKKRPLTQKECNTGTEKDSGRELTPREINHNKILCTKTYTHEEILAEEAKLVKETHRFKILKEAKVEKRHEEVLQAVKNDGATTREQFFAMASGSMSRPTDKTDEEWLATLTTSRKMVDDQIKTVKSEVASKKLPQSEADAIQAWKFQTLVVDIKDLTKAHRAAKKASEEHADDILKKKAFLEATIALMEKKSEHLMLSNGKQADFDATQAALKKAQTELNEIWTEALKIAEAKNEERKRKREALVEARLKLATAEKEVSESDEVAKGEKAAKTKKAKKDRRRA